MKFSFMLMLAFVMIALLQLTTAAKPSSSEAKNAEIEQLVSKFRKFVRESHANDCLDNGIILMDGYSCCSGLSVYIPRNIASHTGARTECTCRSREGLGFPSYSGALLNEYGCCRGLKMFLWKAQNKYVCSNYDPNKKGLGYGVTCRNNSDCQSGHCFNWSGTDGYCGY